MSDMTIKKAQNILLENKYKQVKKNGNKTSNITILIYYNSDKQN